MKIYRLMHDMDDCCQIVGHYATRELAEAAIIPLALDNELTLPVEIDEVTVDGLDALGRVLGALCEWSAQPRTRVENTALPLYDAAHSLCALRTTSSGAPA